jgi:hypothetical protein
MKENSTISAKKGHFLETKKTHHGSHRDRLTGSLATATANFRSLTKYTYKSEHTFDERKQHH